MKCLYLKEKLTQEFNWVWHWNKRMTKIVLFLGLFVGCNLAFSQTQDAWVYLTDKENVQSSIDNPNTILSQKAIDRKNAHGVAIDARDVPVNESYISQLKAQTGISVMAKSKWFNAVHVRGNETDIKALSGLGFVANIDFADKNLNTSRTRQPENKFHIEESQVAFVYGSTQNQVQMIHADALHLQDYTGEGITIAVLDAGFPNVNTMSAFKRLRDNSKLLDGYDFVDRTANIYAFTGNNHGTKVLSTMAAYVQDQFVGSAPDASYYLFRTEDVFSENPIEESYWVEAAERADSLGVDVINSSLGYFDYDNPKYSYTASELNGSTTYITKGATIASEKGILVVVSAGNSGNNAPGYTGVGAPADSPSILTIGAVDSGGTIANFSSRGSAIQLTQKPDVVAQGKGAYVVSNTGSIVANDGTSFSSPITAGAVASLWQALPNASNAEIMDYVRQSASQYMTPDYEYGYGIPNFELALNTALSLQEENITGFKIFPNPVHNILYINVSNENEQSILTIYNMLGKTVLQQTITKSANSIDVSSMDSGMYMINLKWKQGSKTFKLIKS
ncbi:S8 family serine peptidase [Flavobacteriaceae bacterium LMO-SS05]